MTIPLHSRRTSKPCQFRTPSRSSSFRCSLALVTNFSHSPLYVFRDLRTGHPTKDVPPEPVEGFFSLSRSLLTPPQSFVFIQLHTLSFSGSQLSRVLSAVCALLRKKPGVHPYVVIPRLFTVDCRLSAVGQSRATSSISFISPAYEHRPRISLVSPTYAKTGGWPPDETKTLKFCLKCRRADIFDFSPDFSHFFTDPCVPASDPSASLRAGGVRYTTQEGEASVAPTKNPKHGTRATSPALSAATRHSPHSSPSLGLSLRKGVQ
jgi:hypothetical protein